MSRMTIISDIQPVSRAPRGWYIVGGALVSWLLVLSLWMGGSQLMAFILAV